MSLLSRPSAALLAIAVLTGQLAAADSFRAGAARVDITPEKLPVIVNGMFTARTGDKVHDPLHSRALVLSDGTATIAIAVVDNLMLPRDLLDEVKARAAAATGLAVENVLVSATHCHSAPSAMGCLGTDVDAGYRAFLIPRIVESIRLAHEKLKPAQVGWTVFQDYDHNHCRRWIHRSDSKGWTGGRDPFGRDTVVANMHPGYQSPKHIGPSGPADAAFTMLAVRSAQDGEPLALLANYANHYFGGAYVSAGFAGKFGGALAGAIGAGGGLCGADVAGHQRRQHVDELRQTARQSDRGGIHRGGCGTRGRSLEGDRVSRCAALGHD